MNFVLSNYIKPSLLKLHENSCNCSTFTIRDDEYFISRNVSYFLGEDLIYIIDGKCRTRNFLYKVLDLGKIEFLKELKSPIGDPNKAFYGYEDIRTIQWDSDIYFSCTTVNGDDTGTMTFGKIENFDLTIVKQIRTGNRREKNWVPIENMPGHYIYSFDPMVIVNSNSEKFIGYKECKNLHLSGSTQLLEYKDGYVALVHSKDGIARYYHRFIELDRNFRIKRISDQFSFFGVKTEFCVDMKILNGVLRILPAINDGLTYSFEFDFDFLEKILNRVLDDNRKVYWYNQIAMDARDISKEVFAISALYSSDRGIKDEAKRCLDSTKFDPFMRERLSRRLSVG